MAVTFAVLGDSEPEAVAELRRMCEQLGLEPVGPPWQVIGQDKWMARARSATPAERQGVIE